MTMEYKDRRPGLIGCGIVHLLFALALFGFFALMLIGFLASKQAGTPEQMTPGMVMYTSLFYLALAALFAFLGTGSIMARRWAPPLIQVVSWGWLLIGVFGVVAIGLLFPLLRDSIPNAPRGAASAALGCTIVFFAVFAIAVPLIFLLFYRSPDVRATVERLDPEPRWTDGQPIPLMLFASWMFFGAVTTLLSAFMYRALPLGGLVLRGPLVFLFFAAMATFMFWIAVGTVRRMKAAWWSAIALLVVGVGWSAVFFLKMDASVMIEAMGMPSNPQQEAMMNALYSSPFFFVWMGVIWVAYIAFLLYIRRYFFTRPEVPAEQ